MIAYSEGGSSGSCSTIRRTSRRPSSTRSIERSEVRGQRNPRQARPESLFVFSVIFCGNFGDAVNRRDAIYAERLRAFFLCVYRQKKVPVCSANWRARAAARCERRLTIEAGQYRLSVALAPSGARVESVELDL